MWVLMRDHFILDGCFDSKVEADTEADYNRKHYQGRWEVKQVPDDWLFQYMESVEDPDFGRAIANSYT